MNHVCPDLHDSLVYEDVYNEKIVLSLWKIEILYSIEFSKVLLFNFL